MCFRRCFRGPLVAVIGILGLYAIDILAADNTGLAGIAANVTGTFDSLAKLLLGGAYLAGFGLTIAAIFKFKQHKDNPQQVPMGTPITMLLVGIALIFLPSIIKPAGESIFGSDAKSGGITGSGFDSGS